MSHIVKRRGHQEPYEARKVYASVYAACTSTRLQEGEAELIAAKVSQEITSWLKDKNQVTSENIFEETYTLLKKYHTDAAFMYQSHRDIS